jgi:hypothetical protein
MMMVIVRLLLGENHRLRGSQAVKANSPRLKTTPFHVRFVFARPKDWRHISMRYDRCGHTFFSAICIAATVIFWLGQ